MAVDAIQVFYWFGRMLRPQECKCTTARLLVWSVQRQEPQLRYLLQKEMRQVELKMLVADKRKYDGWIRSVD